MNLDELRSVQNKERQKDSLQHLHDSFYEDVGQYVADLKAQRDRAAEEADDPFSNPEVGRLTDEIETAEEVVEAVYERRMGKIVKRASLAAAGMPSDEEGLTTEEKELFSDIVDRIESNKGRVLDVLAGEDAASGDAKTAPDDPTPDPSTADDGGVSAADLMGDGPDVADGASDLESPPEPGNGVPDPVAEAERQRASADGPDEADPGAVDADPSDAGTPADAPTASGPATAPDPAGTADTDAPRRDSAGDETVADGEWVGEDASSAGPADAAASEVAADTDRVTVRITQDVGQILGVDEREYDLTAEDVVTLPEQNVEPLVQRDAAERLD
jgi:DNA replication factor GINS